MKAIKLKSLLAGDDNRDVMVYCPNTGADLIITDVEHQLETDVLWIIAQLPKEGTA